MSDSLHACAVSFLRCCTLTPHLSRPWGDQPNQGFREVSDAAHASGDATMKITSTDNSKRHGPSGSGHPERSNGVLAPFCFSDTISQAQG